MMARARWSLVLFLSMLAAGCSAAMGAGNPGATPAPARVFEMRTYYTFPGKLEDLQTRFRDHTMGFFEKHGMTNVGYWTPQDQPNTLIYIISHPSREAAREAWRTFGQDPEWQKVRAASEANGRIVERVESVFMDATDYSPLK